MKKKLCVLICLICLLVIPVHAVDTMPMVFIPATEIEVDQTDGSFSFDIEIQSTDLYAGAELGVICSQGTVITAVSSTDGTVTGPKAANGLTWFGYFAGEDRFRGTNTVTVQGTCEIGQEGAVAIQDVSVYTVGQQNYASTKVDCGVIVNLRTEPVRQPILEIPELSMDEFDIGALMLIAGLLVIAAVLAGALIYSKYKHHTKHKKENENASE